MELTGDVIVEKGHRLLLRLRTLARWTAGPNTFLAGGVVAASTAGLRTTLDGFSLGSSPPRLLAPSWRWSYSHRAPTCGRLSAWPRSPSSRSRSSSGPARCARCVAAGAIRETDDAPSVRSRRRSGAVIADMLESTVHPKSPRAVEGSSTSVAEFEYGNVEKRHSRVMQRDALIPAIRRPRPAAPNRPLRQRGWSFRRRRVCLIAKRRSSSGVRSQARVVSMHGKRWVGPSGVSVVRRRLRPPVMASSAAAVVIDVGKVCRPRRPRGRPGRAGARGRACPFARVQAGRRVANLS